MQKVEQHTKYYFEPTDNVQDKNWSKEQTDAGRDQRLLNKYKTQGMINFVWKVQDLWNDGYADDDYSKLYEKIRGSIKRWADFYGKKWKKAGIPRDDFESEFWDGAYVLADLGSYDWEEGFLFFETLDLARKRRAIDVARRNRKQREFEARASSLERFHPEYPDPNINHEEQVTTKLVVAQMFNDPLLAIEEKGMIRIIYDNSHFTLRDLADHPQIAKRKLERLRKKLYDYRPF